MTENLHTLPAILERNSIQFAEKPAFREKEFGIWQSWSWKDVYEYVNNLSLGLIRLGIKEGDHICIIGRNRPHLYWSIIAAQNVGAIPTPLYQDAVAQEMIFPISHCSAKMAIVENQEQVDKLIEIKKDIPLLKNIIYLDPRGLRNYKKNNLSSLNDISSPDKLKNITKFQIELKKRQAKQNLDTKSILLYTSGTTGRSKGVVLSNKNVIESGKAGIVFDKIDSNFSLICYLPMAWVGDFAFSMGLGLQSGMCICCPESAETLHDDMWKKIQNFNGIMINEQFHYKFGTNIGDEIQTTDPLINNNKLKSVVVGIYPDYGNSIPQVMINLERFQDYYSNSFPNNFAVDIKKGSFNDVSEYIQNKYDILETDIINQQTIKDFSKNVFEKTFTVTRSLSDAMIIIATLTLLTSLVSLSEIRVINLSPLWALGITRGSLLKIEFAQFLLLILITLFFAIPVGLLICFLLTNYLNVSAFGWKLPFQYYPVMWGKTLLISLICCIISIALPTFLMFKNSTSLMVKRYKNEC